MLKIILNKFLVVLGVVLVALVLTNPSIVELEQYLKSCQLVYKNKQYECYYRQLGKKTNCWIFSIYTANTICSSIKYSSYFNSRDNTPQVIIIGIGKNFFPIEPDDDFIDFFKKRTPK